MNIKNFILFSFLLLLTTNYYGQVGVGTVNPSPSSMLEISSTSDGGATYRGLMPPRVPNVTSRNAINPSVSDMGLMVFVNSTKCLQIWSGSEWVNIRCMDDDVIIDPPGPVLLGIHDFEVAPASPLLPLVSATAGNYTSGNGVKPNTPLYVSPGRGYGFSYDNPVNNAELTFGPVNASAHNSATLKLRLGGFAKNPTNGLDNNDSAIFYISTNGISGPFSSQIKILGGAPPSGGSNANNSWGFESTRTVSVPFDPLGITKEFISGSGNVDGISYIEITGIPNSANIAVKVLLINNHQNELWVIDDVEIYGE